MELLFTKGIRGIIDNSKIMLSSSNKILETNYFYTDEDIIKLEEEYNIKFIGEIINENGLIKRDSDFNFIICKDKNLIDITSLMYELNSSFINLYDLITENIFPNIDDYNSIIDNIPIFITSEGIKPKCFFTRQEFQKSLIDSELWKIIDNETQNKLIYMYDLFSIIDDIQSYVFNLHYNLIEAQKELSTFLKGVHKKFRVEDKDEVAHEYEFHGYHARIISSMYMNVIIELSTCLDIITKLFYEISSFPVTYKKPIKFKSGSIYFSNIKRFQAMFKKCKGYSNSILENYKEYEDLILSRHLIIHNSFFSSSPMLFYGFKTSVVNNKKINYATIYIWDADSEGKPERWLNRCKFYGQNRSADEYIIKYLVKFYEQLGNTLELIKNHLAG